MSEWERSYTNQRRRLYLRVALKLMFSALLGAGVYVMTASLFGTPDGEEAVVRIELREIPPGTYKVVKWAGRRIFILHRTPAMLAALRTMSAARLYDPRSTRDGLPPALRNRLRSLRPDWFVAYDYGTTYGCALALDVKMSAPVDLRDSCGGTRYDVAGRVYAVQDAQRNLTVPPYRFDGDGVLVIGR